MARFKRMPGCSVRDCCGGGGVPGCVKFIPYGVPFAEFFDTANRFSNWNLTGLDSTNTYGAFNPDPPRPDKFEYGHVFVDAVRLAPVPPFGIDYVNYVKIRSNTNTGNDSNVLCKWEAGGTPSAGTINLVEQNGSGVSGTVDYDNPLLTDNSFASLRLRSTQLGCLMTLDSTQIGTVTWEITDISDPFTYAVGTQFFGTSTIIGTYAVAMSSEQTRCLAEKLVDPVGWPLTWTGDPGNPFETFEASYEIWFNYTNGFNLVWKSRGGFGAFDNLTQIEPLFDICSEIPETTLTNAAGSYVTFRMFHTPA